MLKLVFFLAVLKVLSFSSSNETNRINSRAIAAHIPRPPPDEHPNELNLIFVLDSSASTKDVEKFVSDTRPDHWGFLRLGTKKRTTACYAAQSIFDASTQFESDDGYKMSVLKHSRHLPSTVHDVSTGIATAIKSIKETYGRGLVVVSAASVPSDARDDPRYTFLCSGREKIDLRALINHDESVRLIVIPPTNANRDAWINSSIRSKVSTWKGASRHLGPTYKLKSLSSNTEPPLPSQSPGDDQGVKLPQSEKSFPSEQQAPVSSTTESSPSEEPSLERSPNKRPPLVEGQREEHADYSKPGFFSAGSLPRDEDPPQQPTEDVAGEDNAATRGDSQLFPDSRDPLKKGMIAVAAISGFVIACAVGYLLWQRNHPRRRASDEGYLNAAAATFTDSGSSSYVD